MRVMIYVAIALVLSGCYNEETEVVFTKESKGNKGSGLEYIEVDISTLDRDEAVIEVYSLLKNYSFSYPKVVLAQSILETGWFSSELVRTNNNFFGMKVPERRETVGIPSINNNYLFYFCIEDCFLDRKIFENRYMSGLTEEEYMEYLSKNYAEDTQYIEKIQSVIRSIDFDKLVLTSSFE